MRQPNKRVAEIAAVDHVHRADGEGAAAFGLKFGRSYHSSGEAGADPGHAYHRPVEAGKVEDGQFLACCGIGISLRFLLTGNGGTIAHGCPSFVRELARSGTAPAPDCLE